MPNAQPVTIANVTATSRAQVLNLSGALGFEVGNERTSLNNYITLLRAVNPARRMGLPGLSHSLVDKVIRKIPADGLESSGSGKDAQRLVQRKVDVSADTLDILRRGRFLSEKAAETQWDSALSLVLPVIGSLAPAVCDDLVLESLMTEERIATSGGVRDTLLDEVVRSKTAMPMSWHRLFRTAAPHLVDVPVSAILDPLTDGAFTSGASAGGAGTSATATKGYTHLSYFAEAGPAVPFNGEALSSHLFALTQGHGDEAFTRFYNQCLVLDFLHAMPRLSAFFAAENMNLITKDPEQRFASMIRTAKLIRFMSMQPMMFYAACLHHIMVQPQVREDVSRIHENFYNSDLWASFASRAETIRLGHVYRHLWQDVTSGDATTRYGDTHVLRVPSAIASMFDSWNVIIKSTAAAATTSGQITARSAVTAAKADFTVNDPSYFMRHFLRTTGPDEVWTPLASELTAALGYEAPQPAPAVNYLDPPVIMSDGWSSSAPVDYLSATRSIVITPVTFRAGGPAKVALTMVDKLTPADIALESSVERIQTVQRTLTQDQRALLAKEGLAALGSERPCLWVVRHSDAHSLYSNETFVALNGRMPLVMWNGDLDATIIPHTTFEDFAMDLGMSPHGLAALYTDSVKGAALSAVSNRVKAFVSLFFTKRSADDPTPSIFTTANDYGMGTVKFKSHAYFISARAAVLQTASLVGLSPIWATERLTLVTREFSNAVARETVAFRTITSEPLQPKEHSMALRDVVRLDEKVAQDWGTTLSSPKIA